MEILDILDKEGNKTGESRSYEDAHKFGFIHKAVHVWIVNSRSEILIQKREKHRLAYPGHWDISSAGHVSAGETSLQAAKRETKEELGIELKESDFHFLCTLEQHVILNDGNYVNNEFNDVFVVHLSETTPDIKIDHDEVEEVRWISVQDFKDWVEGKGELMVPHMEEYQNLLRYLEAEAVSGEI